jgi:GDP-4-dehydro-6-deoxy-D-mannose reductase
LRVLVTGASGFAGGYLARACAEAGEVVLGVSRSGRVADGAGEGRAVDLTDDHAVRETVRGFRPEVVYHLAALSSVGKSWQEPGRTVQDNVASATNVLEAVRLEARSARLVWVSSCEVYGVPERLPIPENARMNPANPYAVSKCAGDLLAKVYADAFGMDVLRVRPFNHAGPGQLPMFIMSSLAQQGAQARHSGADHVRVVTGNPATRRDFTDVRDVARAYRLLAAHAKPGAYNVSSGRSVSAAEQVALLAELLAPIEVEQVTDPARVRRYEVMDLCGANDRITAATGWRPEIPLRQTMHDALEWWEHELASGRAAR